MSEPRHRILLLTGRPGIGKTTVVRRVCEGFDGRVAGFYTAEIRDDEGRKGFRIVGFDGRECVLAHVDRPGEPRVSKYGVDVEALDEMVAGLPEPEADGPPGGKITAEGGGSMADADADPLYVVDEIGKMECYSERFVTWVHRLLDSDARLLATVARRGEGLIAEVKEHPDAELREVTRRNRDRLPKKILRWLAGE